MKKKELRNVIRKKKIASAKRTIESHKYFDRLVGEKTIEWLKSGESPYNYEKSISEYNKAKEFLKNN